MALVGHNEEMVCTTEMAGAESQTLSPGLEYGLELGGSVELG